jgi:hypothetical protein
MTNTNEQKVYNNFIEALQYQNIKFADKSGGDYFIVAIALEDMLGEQFSIGMTDFPLVIVVLNQDAQDMPTMMRLKYMAADYSINAEKIAELESLGDMRERLSYDCFILLAGGQYVNPTTYSPVIDEYISYSDLQEYIYDGRIGHKLIDHIKRIAVEHFVNWGKILKKLLSE